jgi:hypothetical protein
VLSNFELAFILLWSDSTENLTEACQNWGVILDVRRTLMTGVVVVVVVGLAVLMS